MKKLIVAALVMAVALLALSGQGTSGAPTAEAATDAEIEEAVTKGLAWLDDQQHPTDGYFFSVNRTGATCLALVKFQHRGWELFPPPGQGPFDAGYQYKQTVEDGLDYAFGQMTVSGASIHVQNSVYNTGLCMMAVAASEKPDRVSPLGGKTFKQVVQGMMAWMEGAQMDAGTCNEGGWSYSAVGGNSDNSNSGYATLAIGFAAGMGVYPQAATLTKLSTFIDNVQEPATGGSYYQPCSQYANRVNILKTGNLLYEMALVGRPLGDPTVQAAKGYIENKWNATAVYDIWSFPISWHGRTPSDPQDKGYYQAMFTMMKGLEAYGIETLGAGIGDWFDEVSTYIYNNKVEPAAGKWYWTGTGFGSPAWGGDAVLETAWALLTLEKAVAPPPGVGGIVDIPVEGSHSLVAAPAGSSGGSWVPYYAALAGAAFLALTATAWYARRRWLR